MPDRTPEQVLAERLAVHRSGLASDGQGWFRTDAEREEMSAAARDLLAGLTDAGHSIVPSAEIERLKGTEARIAKALEFAGEYGTTAGDHHKMWVIDQMVRALTGCPVVTRTSAAGCKYEEQGESREYEAFTRDKYDSAWDAGTAP